MSVKLQTYFKHTIVQAGGPMYFYCIPNSNIEVRHLPANPAVFFPYKHTGDSHLNRLQWQLLSM